MKKREYTQKIGREGDGDEEVGVESSGAGGWIKRERCGERKKGRKR